MKNTRGVRKQHMIYNAYLPKMEIDAQTYAVRADGQLLTRKPVTSLPMAQQYFLFRYKSAILGFMPYALHTPDGNGLFG